MSGFGHLAQKLDQSQNDPGTPHVPVIEAGQKG